MAPAPFQILPRATAGRFRAKRAPAVRSRSSSDATVDCVSRGRGGLACRLVCLWRRQFRLALGVVFISSLGWAGMAHADATPRLDLTQAVYDKAGQPSLTANFFPDGSLARPGWSVCDEAGRCTPGPQSRAVWNPGPTRSGATFEAHATYLGTGYTARSPRWLGALRNVRRPTLAGRPAVGSVLRPVGGTWAGGWDRAGDYSRLRVEVCRTRAARSCLTLSAQGEDYPGHGAPPTLSRRYVGWYAFAVDQRFAPGTVFGGVGYAKSERIPPAKIGPTVVRSSARGPITRR